MKTRIVAPAVSVCVLVGAALLWLGGGGKAPRDEPRTAVAADWGRVPLAFEPAPDGSFVARGPSYRLTIQAGANVLRLGRDGALVTRLAGASLKPPRAERRLLGVVNYFKGKNPARWRTGVPTYARVRQAGVYPGIDVTYYGRPGALEYDFEVAPGATPSAIALRLTGARGLGLDRTGDLIAWTAAGVVREHRPRAYQVIGGRRVSVNASFKLTGRTLQFEVGRYDRSRSLVIDPIVSYSTFVPGSERRAIAVDTTDAAYVAGESSGDAVVTKLDPTGSQAIYSTVFGGSSSDEALAIAVDGSGQAYVAGETSSNNFPTPNGSDTSLAGTQDGFVAKLTASGSLASGWSRYYGGTGSDELHGLDIEGTNVHVAGWTTTTSGMAVGSAYQTSNGGADDIIYARLNQSNNVVTYATFLGNTGYDHAMGLVADSGKAAIAGETSSASFPTKSGADATYGGSTDGFVAQFDPSQATAANTLTYSTFVGAAGTDIVNAIAGSTGNVHIAGQTTSSTGMPLAASPAFGGDIDGFVVTLLSGTTFQNGHYIGSGGRDRARGIAIDTAGTDYVTGDTSSNGFPHVNWSQPNGSDGNENVFFVKHGAGGAGTPVFAAAGQLGGTLAGGDEGLAIAVDSSRNAYIAGYAQSDFATTDGAFDRVASSRTGFAVKIVGVAPTITKAPAGAVPQTSASFEFTATESNISLECSMDSTTTFSPCSSPKNYLSLGQGAHTFRVRTSDAYSAKSPVASAVFTLDTISPAVPELIAPAQDAETGTQPDFSWKPAVDATTSVRYALVIDDAAEDVSATCTQDACTAKSAKSLVTGVHTWAVKAIDEAGNSTTSATRTFKALDPPTARFTIAPNPALAGRNVSFDGSASADATHQITKYEWDLDGNGTFESNGGTSAIATKAYSKAQTVNVGLRVTDSSGLTGTTTTKLTITSSPGTAAQLGVTINNGAQYTKTPDVVINAVFPSSTTSMLFSNDGGFLKPETFKPDAETKWKLDSSGPERLPKIVYVRFLTGPFVSETFTDDIILDETPPKVEQAAVEGAALAPPAATAAAAKRTYTLKIKATDSNSGVKGVYVTANKKKPGKLIKYKRKIKVKATTRKLYVRARDKAGNLSRWRKAH